MTTEKTIHHPSNTTFICPNNTITIILVTFCGCNQRLICSFITYQTTKPTRPTELRLSLTQSALSLTCPASKWFTIRWATSNNCTVFAHWGCSLIQWYVMSLSCEQLSETLIQMFLAIWVFSVCSIFVIRTTYPSYYILFLYVFSLLLSLASPLSQLISESGSSILLKLCQEIDPVQRTYRNVILVVSDPHLFMICIMPIYAKFVKHIYLWNYWSDWFVL